MPKDLREIDYKSEQYLSYQAANKRHKEACQRLQRKRKELPRRETDPAEILEWTLAKQDVSQTLKAKNKAFDVYNASIRSQLSIEQLGLERFEAIKEAIEAQNKIDAFKAEPEMPKAFRKIAEAFEKAASGIKPEDLTEPKGGLYEFMPSPELPEATDEERAIAAQDVKSLEEKRRIEREFNARNPTEGQLDKHRRMYRELKKAGIPEEEIKKALGEFEGRPKEKS